MAWLFENISVKSSPQQNKMWARIACTPSQAVIVKYAKMRLEDHRKAVFPEVKKSVMERKGTPFALVKWS